MFFPALFYYCLLLANAWYTRSIFAGPTLFRTRCRMSSAFLFALMSHPPRTTCPNLLASHWQLTGFSRSQVDWLLQAEDLLVSNVLFTACYVCCRWRLVPRRCCANGRMCFLCANGRMRPRRHSFIQHPKAVEINVARCFIAEENQVGIFSQKELSCSHELNGVSCELAATLPRFVVVVASIIRISIHVCPGVIRCIIYILRYRVLIVLHPLLRLSLSYLRSMAFVLSAVHKCVLRWRWESSIVVVFHPDCHQRICC